MVSGILLCALLVCGPFAAHAQNTVTIIKNVQKTVTKTVNVVNGNGWFPYSSQAQATGHPSFLAQSLPSHCSPPMLELLHKPASVDPSPLQLGLTRCMSPL